ncbi:restriction endonuclease subunit S [Streptomyces cellostaticus]|uniref:restriction endonuclease subunit S n=1 Tax=Streptomyces cellostaticus TaxID=67285 RepID=UPI0020260595|nr:restriction endonuclease subunit S [Streptomyces cellostaticus]
MNTSAVTPPSRKPSGTYELVRLGYVARLQNGLTVDAKRDVTGDVVTSPYLRVANVQAGSLNLESVTEITVPRSVAQRSTLRPGDVLMTEGGDLDKLGRGTVWRGELDQCLHQNHIFAVRPDPQRLSGRFLAYVTQSLYGRHYFESTGTRTTNLASTNSSKIQSFPLPLPPLDEQRRIADFLDAETARIDRLCELRKHQLELLNEASFRRIYDAVRGAHVEGNRKDSGLKWLGTIPSDWRIGSVSHYFEVELGKMLNQERAHGQHMRPYLRVANVQWDRIDVSDLAMMDFPPEEQARYRLKPGDLLVNEGGSWPGRAAIWDGEVPEIYYQKALHRIRARGAELPRWLYYCLVVAERLKVFQVQGNTSTMTHLTREGLRPQKFPFPEPDVQGDLVAQLDRAASRDFEFRRLLDSQVALLTERRQALITAAVTGQFDVSTASGRGIQNCSA